jgi:hypothetical protein
MVYVTVCKKKLKKFLFLFPLVERDDCPSMGKSIAAHGGQPPPPPPPKPPSPPFPST